MYYIYRITNLIDGKTYIGQHKYKKLNDNYMGSGVRLRRAQKKHGIENFKKDILIFNIVEKSFIDVLEKEYIKFYRSIGKAEYNIADGGQGINGNKGRKLGPFSEEHKKKISEALKGKCHSEETRKKMSETRKGEHNAFYGKHHSEETRKHWSEVRKGKHWKLVDGKRVWY